MGREYKIWYRSQYLNSVCHVCKKDWSSESIVCGKCGVVTYCCDLHLEEDLDEHEDLCDAVVEAGRLLGGKHWLDRAYLLGPEELRQFRLGVVGLCSKRMGRLLQPWEIEVCLYPPLCATCHKFDPGLDRCSDCMYTRWCSQEHKPKSHSVHCSHLKLFKEILQKAVNVVAPPHQVTELPPSMDVLVAQPRDEVNFSLLTEIATSPLTLLSALPAVSSALVHIIGPEPFFEANNLSKWESFLFELRLSLEQLSLAFIGPEIGPLTPRTVKKDGRTLKLTFHQQLYHNYTSDAVPTLICAFNPGLYRNSGFNGEDTWTDTVSAMFHHPGVPVLVTAYTQKEVLLDVARIRRQIPQVITLVTPQQNPFSSMRPQMNFVSDEETPIVFKNAFYAILKA